MKTSLVLVLIFLAGAVGYFVGRRTGVTMAVPSRPERPAAVAAAAMAPTVQPQAAEEQSVRLGQTEDRLSPSDLAWQVPSAQTAEWVHAARAVDRRFGVLYRICALNPGEHRMLRQLLTREMLLQGKADELREKGASPQQIQSALADESARVAELQTQLETQMPEVARFVGEFKARPVAATATADIAERIMIETGTVSPDQLETIFSAASQSESSHPTPEFANSLRFDHEPGSSVANAGKALLERNRKFIPDVVKVLDDAQISAFMAYMEEQLLAVQTGGKAP